MKTVEPNYSRLLILTAFLLIYAVGVSVLAWAGYHYGKDRGREEERFRRLRKGDAVQVSPLPTPRSALEADASPPESPASLQDEKNQFWCFSALEASRVTWPMEILERSEKAPFPHIRNREGSNRFASRSDGLVEFIFETRKDALITAYLRMRYSDECGNSVRFGINDSPLLMTGDSNVFGQWIWERTIRRFNVGPGLHRAILASLEDGVEIDRIVLTTTSPSRKIPVAELDALPVTTPPRFHSIPMTGEDLPEIGPLEVSVYPVASLMVAPDHDNTLLCLFRNHEGRAWNGTIQLEALRSTYKESLPFSLAPEEPYKLISLMPKLIRQERALNPVLIRVISEGNLLFSKTLCFYNPMNWALLAPLPDPERMGVNLPSPLEFNAGNLPLLLHPEQGDWRVITDGSGYNELGVLDFNKVFSRPEIAPLNSRSGWPDNDQPTLVPEVVYAVTVMPSFKNPHNVIAYGGDNNLKVWVNGNELLTTYSNAPLETSRQVVATPLDEGRNIFLFKVPQTDGKWQLLFYPDTTHPYGLVDFMWTLPPAAWGE